MNKSITLIVHLLIVLICGEHLTKGINPFVEDDIGYNAVALERENEPVLTYNSAERRKSILQNDFDASSKEKKNNLIVSHSASTKQQLEELILIFENLSSQTSKYYVDEIHKIEEKLILMEEEVLNLKEQLELKHQEAVKLQRGNALLNHDLIKLNEEMTKNKDQESSGFGIMSAEMSSPELLDKIHSILSPVHTILESVGSIESAVNSVNKNINQISDTAGYIQESENELVTKESLNALLAGHTTQDTAQPATTLTTSQLGLLHIMQDQQEPKQRKQVPEDCADVLQLYMEYQANPEMELTHAVGRNSGIYLVQPKKASRPFFVYCDMDTNGGGWTVFQKRVGGETDFQQDWNGYKDGFGNIVGEFWLGLEKLHLLTNNKANKLLIKTKRNGREASTATYTDFAIGTEAEKYQISVLGEMKTISGDPESLSEAVGNSFNITCNWWNCQSSLNSPDYFTKNDEYDQYDEYGEYYQYGFFRRIPFKFSRKNTRSHNIGNELPETLMAIRPR